MKAKVLLLHHNYPAHFRFIALDLAQAGHEVVFLTERNLVGELPGIRQINVADQSVSVRAGWTHNWIARLAFAQR